MSDARDLLQLCDSRLRTSLGHTEPVLRCHALECEWSIRCTPTSLSLHRRVANAPVRVYTLAKGGYTETAHPHSFPVFIAGIFTDEAAGSNIRVTLAFTDGCVRCCIDDENLVRHDGVLKRIASR